MPSDSGPDGNYRIGSSTIRSVRFDDWDWTHALDRAAEEHTTRSEVLQSFLADYARGVSSKLRLSAEQRARAIRALECQLSAPALLDAVLEQINEET